MEERKKDYKILSIIFIFLILIISSLFFHETFAISITSNYYKIDTQNKIISRLGPKTSVEIFKKATNIQNGELKVYKDISLKEEVNTGYIGTGMVATDGEKKEIYQISVIGDLDGDGIASQVEVTHIIRYLTGLKGYDLEGLQKISADINDDGNVNQIDVTKYINYLVYGELDIKRPEPDFDIIAPEVNVTVQNKTTSTITVKVSATDNKDMPDPFIYVYYIKETDQPDSSYQHKKSTTDDTFTFTRLKMNKNYTIKVETADAAGNKGFKEINVKTVGDSDVLDGTVQISSPEWEDGKASVTVTTDTNLDIEYQINGGEWIKLPEGQNTITDLNNGDTVNVRVTDGTNTGNYTSITIKDLEPPTVDLQLGEPTTSKIQATASNARDDQTGIETPVTYKFYIKKSNESDNKYQLKETSTTSSFMFTELLQNTEYTIKVEVTDKAGNIGNAVKTATTKTIPSLDDIIDVKDPVWNDGEASIEIDIDKDKLDEDTKVLVQINGGEWTELPEDQNTISGLKDEDEVHIKVTDGTNESEEIVIIIKDKIPPTIDLQVGTPTTSSVQATVASVTDAQTGISDEVTYKFYIKKTSEPDTAYVEKQNTTSKQCTFTELLQNTSYTIKVEVPDVAGNIGTATKEVTTSGVPSGGGNTGTGAIQLGFLFWRDGKANIQARTERREFELEYQVNSTSGEWIRPQPRYETTQTYSIKVIDINELNNLDVVYARLTDGINAGEYATLKIQDLEKPTLNLQIGEKTKTSIQVTANATDNETGISPDAKYKFYIKEQNQDDSNYQVKQDTTSNTCNFTGLTTNVTYTIKVEIEDIARNVGSITQNESTLGIPAGSESGAIIFGNVTWNARKANLGISTNTDYQIEYQVGSTTGEWIKVSEGLKSTIVTDLNHNDIVYARLTDGNNSGDYARKVIQDTINPQVEAEITETTTSTIKMNVAAVDNQTGISPDEKYNFYIKKTSQADTWYDLKQNTTSKECTFTGLSQNTSYTVKVEVSDIAGNIGSLTKQVTTGEVPDGKDESGASTGAIEFETPVWNSGKASVVIKTNRDFQIEYKVNGTTGEWTRATKEEKRVTVTNLNHNDDVYARLTDGTNTGDWATVKIADAVAPTLTLDLQPSASTIIATASATDMQSGISDTAIYKFSIKETSRDDSTYVVKQNTTDRVCTITGLTQNVSYTIKVETSDIAGNSASITKTTTTTGIPSGTESGAIQFGSPSWSGGKASIVVSTTTNYQIQYQLNSYEGNWTKVQVGQKNTTISNLNHGTVIYARLADGDNVGQYASTTIADSDNPTATISMSATSLNMNQALTATVIQNDAQSGINISQCKWVFNNNSGDIGTNAGSYTGGTFSNTNQTISIPTNSEGTFYLHVLTVDNSGKAIETKSGAIQIVDERKIYNLGQYVKYNITYTDMYTGYNFTANDGWRVLDPKGTDDRGNTVVKIISTGIPVKLNYYDGKVSSWVSNGWSNASSYANKFYSSGSTDNPNMLMAGQLYYNFKNITFMKDLPGTSSSGSNIHCLMTNIHGQTSSTKGNIFLMGGATDVSALTLTEINEARNKKVGSKQFGLKAGETNFDMSLTSNNDAAPGLFNLIDLGKYNYSDSTYNNNNTFNAGYFTASPFYEKGSSGNYNENHLFIAKPNGSFAIGSTQYVLGMRVVLTVPIDTILEKVPN